MSILLVSIIATIIFIISDMIIGEKKSLFITILLIFVGSLLVSISTKEYSLLSLLEPIIVLIVGGIAYYISNIKLFKYHPIIINFVCIIILVFYRLLGTSLFERYRTFIQKMYLDINKNNELSNIDNINFLIDMYINIDKYLIVMFLVHSLIVYVTIKKTNNNIAWALSKFSIYLLYIITIIIYKTKNNF